MLLLLLIISCSAALPLYADYKRHPDANLVSQSRKEIKVAAVEVLNELQGKLVHGPASTAAYSYLVQSTMTRTRESLKDKLPPWLYKTLVFLLKWLIKRVS